VQCAVGDRGHVGLFHIFGAHAIKHFAVNANVFKGNVTAAAGAGSVNAKAANQNKSDDQHGAGQEENLNLFGHQTDLYLILYETKERLQR
jgi:hypothetical protein